MKHHCLSGSRASARSFGKFFSLCTETAAIKPAMKAPRQAPRFSGGERLGERLVRQRQRLGDGTGDDGACMNVQSGGEVRVVGERLAPALVGERQDKGQRRVAERERRRASNAA